MSQIDKLLTKNVKQKILTPVCFPKGHVEKKTPAGMNNVANMGLGLPILTKYLQIVINIGIPININQYILLVLSIINYIDALLVLGKKTLIKLTVRVNHVSGKPDQYIQCK